MVSLFTMYFAMFSCNIVKSQFFIVDGSNPLIHKSKLLITALYLIYYKVPNVDTLNFENSQVLSFEISFYGTPLPLIQYCT